MTKEKDGQDSWPEFLPVTSVLLRLPYSMVELRMVGLSIKCRAPRSSVPAKIGRVKRVWGPLEPSQKSHGDTSTRWYQTQSPDHPDADMHRKGQCPASSQEEQKTHCFVFFCYHEVSSERMLRKVFRGM